MNVEMEMCYFKVLIFPPFVCAAVIFVILENTSHQLAPSHTHTHTHTYTHIYIYKVRPKFSVKGTRKKEDTNNLIILVFYNDPYPSQHTVDNVHQSFWKVSEMASLVVVRRTL
jgi:hypothetical protein